MKTLAAERGLDDAQCQAAAATASTDPLVMVEGAAGAGKTTMLGVAIAAATRRSAKRRLDAARAEAQDARARVLDQWDSLPATGPWAANTRDGLGAWAERVAHERAHAAPSVATARQQVEVAGEVLKQTRWRHRAETEELTIGVYGRRDAASIRTVSGAHSAEARAQRWQQYADDSRADLAHIESLPIGRAVQFIETRQAQVSESGVGRTAAARDARLDLRTEHRIDQADPELGRSL